MNPNISFVPRLGVKRSWVQLSSSRPFFVFVASFPAEWCVFCFSLYPVQSEGSAKNDPVRDSPLRTVLRAVRTISSRSRMLSRSPRKQAPSASRLKSANSRQGIFASLQIEYPRQIPSIKRRLFNTSVLERSMCRKSISTSSSSSKARKRCMFSLIPAEMVTEVSPEVNVRGPCRAASTIAV